MNERIQELAKRATNNILGVEVLDQKKFAELIVRECSQTVQDFVDHRIPASEYPDRLKRHFNVK